ncbi:hypothetical protein D3M96_05260 [Alcaligenes aquatilis]|uniref:Uncharacterized protein n=1 Tax=Alcaligenes aquatilis TaxID=323284 RepID=A0A3G2HSG9_9BURK|nr:hypothetical protein D3M96_05260 [Alcaligenes aquatilis]
MICLAWLGLAWLGLAWLGLAWLVALLGLAQPANCLASQCESHARPSVCQLGPERLQAGCIVVRQAHPASTHLARPVQTSSRLRSLISLCQACTSASKEAWVRGWLAIHSWSR